MKKIIENLFSDIEDQSYPYRLLNDYIKHFKLERAHFSGIDENGHAEIYESIGWEEMPDLYRKYEEYDLWIPENMPLPLKVTPLNLDIATNNYLATINPLYEYINKHVKKLSIIGSAHPGKIGIAGFRFDYDFTVSELFEHELISSLMSTAYHWHKKIIQSRDLSSILLSLISDDNIFAIVDDSGYIIHSSSSFSSVITNEGIDANVLKLKITDFNTSAHLPLSEIRHSITIEDLSETYNLRIETLINNGKLFYILTIQEKKKILFTPKEIEIFKLIHDGRSNKDISEMLRISTETVKRHIYNMFKKSGTRNRTELSHIKL